MYTQKENFEWQDWLKIALAVMTFGFGWFADNQSTVIAYSSMLIVWGIGYVIQQSDKFPELKWLKGKGPLTVMIFLVSFGLSFLFQPFNLPSLPSWTGDAGSYIPLFSVWLSVFFSIIGNAVAFSMSVYNLLLAKVLEKIPDIGK